MKPTQWPTWVLVLFGVVAVVAGVLGVIHAPPAVGKATWVVVTGLGAVALVTAARRLLGERFRATKSHPRSRVQR